MKRTVSPHPLDLEPSHGRRFSLHRWLGRRAPATIAVVSLILAGIVGFADFQTGPQVSFVLFYLAPIGIAAWYGSRALGYVLAAVCGTSWVVDELMDLGHDSVTLFVWNAVVRVALFAIVAYLLSSLRARLADLSAQARTDPLTGLANRRGLYERIVAERQRMARHPRPLTLLGIDVDDFKQVNDQHGHVFGDQVLRSVGEALASQLRSTDIAARTGGDEFVVLLIETSADEGSEVAGKLREAMRVRMASLGRPVTFSLGMVTFEQVPEGVDQMFRIMDANLYAAKREGKDRVVGGLAPRADTPAG